MKGGWKGGEKQIGELIGYQKVNGLRRWERRSSGGAKKRNEANRKKEGGRRNNERKK